LLLKSRCRSTYYSVLCLRSQPLKPSAYEKLQHFKLSGHRVLAPSNSNHHLHNTHIFFIGIRRNVALHTPLTSTVSCTLKGYMYFMDWLVMHLSCVQVMACGSRVARTKWGGRTPRREEGVPLEEITLQWHLYRERYVHISCLFLPIKPSSSETP